jgi:formylglycine-generating enzyme required for sulfatase activity
MTKDSHPMDTARIRKLLLASFTAEELRRFCQDHPSFHPVLDSLGPSASLHQTADQLITHCEKRILFDELLIEVEKVNPRQYARFAPYRPANPLLPRTWPGWLQISVALLVLVLIAVIGWLVIEGGPPSATTAGTSWTRPKDGITMVFVPGGTFEMGSDLTKDPMADDDELPVHRVTLDSYWIDRTEVTNFQFAAFLNKQGNKMEGGVTWLDLEAQDCLIEQVAGQYQPKSRYANHPVVQVSWYGAAAYCDWAGGQLPTEAEWEYAARGPDERIYPWGNEFDCAGGNLHDRFTDCNDGYEFTAPVGQFPRGASWCDALDMAGNVWEWVYDWRGGYSDKPQVNPAGPRTGDSKVVRGSWCTPKETDGRTAHRDSRVPETREWHIGFRCLVPAGP